MLEQLQQPPATEAEFTTTLPPETAQFAEALTDEIFGGLMNELISKYNFELLVNRDSERALQLQYQQQQEQMQIQQQLKGIKTDLFAIERYVDEIVEQIKGKSSA